MNIYQEIDDKAKRSKGWFNLLSDPLYIDMLEDLAIRAESLIGENVDFNDSRVDGRARSLNIGDDLKINVIWAGVETFKAPILEMFALSDSGRWERVSKVTFRDAVSLSRQFENRVNEFISEVE